METVPPDLWSDLVDQPFIKDGRDPLFGLDCYGLIKEAYRRRGVDVPEFPHLVRNPVDQLVRMGGWKAVDQGSLEPWDLVGTQHRATWRQDHVALYLGGDLLLHAIEGHGVKVTSLSALAASGTIRRCLRWTGEPGPVAPWTAPAKERCVTVVIVDDPLGSPHRRRMTFVEVRPGMTVRDLVPLRWRRTPDHVTCFGADGAVSLDRPVLAGDKFAVAYCPQGPAFLTAFLVSLAISAVSFFIQLLLAPSAEDRGPDDFGSPTFDLSGIRNTAATGIPIPVVYGRHVIGGNVTQFFVDVDEERRQVLNLVLDLCHGPIKSIGGLTSDFDLLQGAAIPADIKINGNPASSYEGVKVSGRLGYESQSPFYGFNRTVTSTQYAVVLDDGVPFTHFSTEERTGFGVIISCPGGMYGTDDDGSFEEVQVLTQVRWRKVGTTAWSGPITRALIGSTPGPISEKIDIDVSSDPGIYEVEVTRNTDWPTDAGTSTQTNLQFVNEYSGDSLSAPGVARLAIQAVSDEQLPGGAPPTVTSIVEGKLVYVWDGVDADNPNFGERQYSKSPAWCVHDMFIDPVYGVARNVPFHVDGMDLDAYLEWAQHSATLVADGRGGMMARAELDLVVDVTQDAWPFLSQVANSHWAALTVVGSKVRPVVMKARDSTGLINAATARAFVRDVSGPKTLHNVVEVRYRNAETNWERDQARVAVDTLTPSDERNVESIEALGVVRPAQAYRLAQYKLNWNRIALAEQFGAEVGHEFLDKLPGDVVDVLDEAVEWTDAGRCRAGCTTTDLKFDKDKTFVTDDRVLIRYRDATTGEDQLVDRALPVGTFTAGTVVTVSPALPVAPEEGSPVSFGNGTTFRKQFFVMSLDTDPGTLVRKVQGVSYDVTLFDDDPGDVEEFTDEWIDVRRLPGPVTDLKVTERATRQCDGATHSFFEVTWTKERAGDAVDLWFRRRPGDGDATPFNDRRSWRYWGRSWGDGAMVVGYGCGSIVEFAALAVTPAGVRHSFDTAVRSTLAQLGTSVRPTTLVAADCDVRQLGDHLVLTLPDFPSRDVAWYEVRLGVTWAGALVLARCLPGTTTIPVPGIGALTLLVRPVNRTALAAGQDATLTVTTETSSDVDVVTLNQDYHAGWTLGTVVDLVVSGGYLELDVGAALEGTFETDALVGASAVRGRLLVHAEFDLKPTTPEGNEMSYLPDSPILAGIDATDIVLTGHEVEEAEKQPIEQQNWEGDSLIPELWGTDVFAALTPSVEIRTSADGATWTDWVKYVPEERSNVRDVQVRVTLRSPHARYVPRLRALNVSFVRRATGGGGGGDFGYDDVMFLIDFGF